MRVVEMTQLGGLSPRFFWGADDWAIPAGKLCEVPQSAKDETCDEVLAPG